MQIQERHKIVEKIREHELNDVKGDLYQCQKEQDAIAESKVGTSAIQGRWNYIGDSFKEFLVLTNLSNSCALL